MTIGIAGIGGIGSNVARILVQAGIKALKIVDFDRVELSNLNWQFYFHGQAGKRKTASLEQNLYGISPDVRVETVDRKISAGDVAEIFAGCRLVVEGFDDRRLKKMIIEELSSSGMPVISASGIAGGQLANIRVKQMGNCWIVGDLTSDQEDHELYPPKIAMITALMADLVLEKTKDR